MSSRDSRRFLKLSGPRVLPCKRGDFCKRRGGWARSVLGKLRSALTCAELGLPVQNATVSVLPWTSKALSAPEAVGLRRPTRHPRFPEAHTKGAEKRRTRKLNKAACSHEDRPPRVCTVQLSNCDLGTGKLRFCIWNGHAVPEALDGQLGRLVPIAEWMSLVQNQSVLRTVFTYALFKAPSLFRLWMWQPKGPLLLKEPATDERSRPTGAWW